MGWFKFFRDLNLGFKLNIVVMLALGLLLIVTLLVTRQSVANLTLETGQQRVEQEVTVFQRRFEEVEQELLASTKLLAIRPGLLEAVVSRDLSAIRTTALTGAGPLDLDDVDLIDANGERLITVLASGAESSDPEQEDALLSLALLGIETTETLFAPNSEKPDLRLAAVVPIRDQSGAIVAALFASRIVDDQFLAEINFSRDDLVLSLVDGNEILAQSSQAQEHVELLSGSRPFILDQIAIEQALQGQTTIANQLLTFAGIPYALAHAPLAVGSEPKAALAILVDLTGVATFQNQLATTLTIISGLLALGVVGGLVLFTRQSITRPIYNLQQAAQQLAAGDYSQRIEGSRQDEIGQLGQAFNAMAKQIRELITGLEDRVQERTRALETGAEISRQVTTILDVDELLPYVVNRLQSEFDFYHTHIYLVEEGSGDLVMAWGAGEVGRQLKERGHRLPAGQGIVGTVASINEPFISNDVDKVLNFVRNPLLPNTKSELAVPLRKVDRVLGVLDIQSEQINRFSPEDISLMQSIANQTATAIDNARLLAETQVALAEVERLNRRLTRDSWIEVGKEATHRGYRFKNGTITSDSELMLPPMKLAAQQKQLVKQIQGNNGGGEAELAVPLMLRGELIGVLGVKRGEQASWADEEVSAVEAVANQIALALENARLSEEQEKTIVKLQDVDRIKSEFLTSMSHELRTPLNSILGFADVLLQGIDGELNDLALNDINLIYNSAQHLLALINDILDISKIEAGMMELVPEAVALDEIMREVLAAAHSLLNNKPVKVLTEISAELPPVYADKLRLRQILLNLASNAAKFTKEGQITIGAEIHPANPHQMHIWIEDTGIGIPDEKLVAIFDRFSQADNSITRQYGGTGLGLPICKQLVELHGGTIGVSSQVGAGSKFYFTIPLNDVSAVG